jgi:hypothetical protein
MARAATDSILHLTPVDEDAIKPSGSGTNVAAYLDLVSSPLPIGIDLDMFWRITTVGGTVVDTVHTTVPWTDDRFEWLHSSAGSVRIHYYALSSGFANSVLTAAAATVASMQETYGFAFNESIDVWIYASTADFRGTLAANSREAVAGISYPGYGVIHLVLADGDSREIGRTVTHEVAHQVVASALGPVGTIPLWLDEGIATHAQTEGIDGYLPLSVYAVQNDKRFSLASLDGSFPYIASDASIGYAVSWSAIAMIEEGWGPEAIGELVHALGEGMPTDDAIRAILGTTLAELDRDLDAWLMTKASS